MKIRVMLLGVLCAGVAGSFGSANAAPGEGIRLGGDVLVRPFVNAGVSYDSNPLVLPEGDEKSDTFTDVNPGVSVSKSGEKISVDALLWGRFRRFDKFDSEDQDDWSQKVSLKLGRRDGWQLGLHERYGRVTDYDVSDPSPADSERTSDDVTAPPLAAVERSSRVNRDLLDVGITIGGPISDKNAVGLRYDYGKTDYDPAYLLDSEEQKVAAKAARKLTDKSSAIVIAEYIMMDNDSLNDPANYYAARAGWRWQGTDKSQFEGSVGFYQFSLKDTADVEQDSDGVSYSLAWYWQALSKVLVSVGARSDVQLSAEAAAVSKSVDSVSAGVQYDASEKLSVALLLGYRNEDYIDVDASAEQYHARVRCNYQVQKWLNVFGEVWQDQVSSGSLGDSEESRVTLGVKALY